LREFIDGSVAIVRGALDAGCTFFAGYPITPASPILMQLLRELPKVGGVAIQGEDEIASIGMCIGATLSGSRAMTATSGPGLSLYSENIGLAVMGEVPLVIVDVQRLGPATGGATTVGQGDVQFVRWGTAGGYPIIALAPSSVSECYTATRRAFELADRFRCPVFVVTDKELNMTTVTVEMPERERPCATPSPEASPRETEERSRQPMYRFDPPDGVPVLTPFGSEKLVRFTGSTHDERAIITKNPKTVAALNEHLRAKIDEHVSEIEWVTSDDEPGASTLWISYGVTAGAMREAVARARAAGYRIAALTIHSLWPVPEEAVRKAARRVKRVVVAELNHGQYRREIERIITDREVKGIERVDGELIEPDRFLELLP